MPTTQEWIDELKSISVLELSERIKALEETFGVSATAVAVAAHLDVCAACVEEVATYRWLKSALRRQRTIDHDAVGRLCAFAALLTRGCR